VIISPTQPGFVPMMGTPLRAKTITSAEIKFLATSKTISQSKPLEVMYNDMM